MPTFTRPQMSPSLYATPTEIPLPNSPSSFPPSPYIVNHKGRGPYHGNADVEATTSLRKSTSLSFPVSEAIAEVHTKGIRERPVWDCSPPHGKFWNEKSGRDIGNGLEWESYLLESVRIKANKERESGDFYNRGESVSFDAGAEDSHKLSSSGGEFYDARDGIFLYLFFLPTISSCDVWHFQYNMNHHFCHFLESLFFNFKCINTFIFVVK